MRLVWQLLTGVLCVAVVTGLTLGADYLRVPAATPVAATAVQIAPAEVPYVCPGPAQLASTDAGADPAFDPVPSGTTSVLTGLVRVPSGPAPDGLRELSGEPLGALTVGLDGAAGAGAVQGPSAVWATPDHTGQIRAAGTITSVTSAGDLRGLAAASCEPPSSEQWLVGGSTELGSSSRLVLQNPSGTPAVVEIEVWGPTGRIELAGPGTFAVPPFGQTATLLEGLAAQQRRLAIRVTSSGALVSSYLQVNYLEGLTPSGVDFVTSSSAPSARQIMTGLTVQGSKIGDASGALLRILAPGEKDARVDVTVLGPNGRVLLPGADVAEAPAEELIDLSLAGLDAGTYSVLLESDAPIVASALITRTAGDVSGPTAVPASTPRDVAFVAARDLDDEPGAGAGAGAGGVGLGDATMAIPTALQTRLTLLAVPTDVKSVPSALVGDVPQEDVATADEDAPANEGLPADEGAPPPAVPPVPVDIVLVNTAGHIVGTYPVDLIPGLTRVLDPAAFAPGAAIAGMYVQRPEPVQGNKEQLVTWSATVFAGEMADGLISVLSPVPAERTASELAVRPGLATGLN